MNKIAASKLTTLREIANAFLPVGVVDINDAGVITGINLPGQCNGTASFGLKYDVSFDQIVVSPRWPMSQLEKNKHNYQTMILPRDLRDSDGLGCPSIRISATKDAATIVKEIFRRFLPIYLPLLARCITLRDANDREILARDAAFDRIKAAAVIGGVQPGAHGNTISVPEGTLQVWGSDSVEVKLNLTLENACKLVIFLDTLS